MFFVVVVVVADEPKAASIKSVKKRERPAPGKRPKVEQQIYVPPARKNASEKGGGGVTRSLI